MGTYTKICVTLPDDYPDVIDYIKQLDDSDNICIRFLQGIQGLPAPTWGLLSWANESKHICVEYFIERLTPFFTDVLKRNRYSHIVILSEVELSCAIHADVLRLRDDTLYQEPFMLPFSWSTYDDD